MRKRPIITIFNIILIAVPLFLFACGTLPRRTLPRLVVVPFQVNATSQKAQEDATAIRDAVQSNMASSGRYEIITMDKIDQEGIQVNDISSPENIRKLQSQNIDYIVTGTVDATDNGYSVTISLLDVSSGSFTRNARESMSNTSSDIKDKTADLVQELAREGNTVIYNIGDRGPAMGLVFYDKGIFFNGWRYLEAAPVETEFNVV